MTINTDFVCSVEDAGEGNGGKTCPTFGLNPEEIFTLDDNLILNK